MTGLTFNELREKNAARVAKWHPPVDNPLDRWTGADWSNAAAGEMGEAANVVKKLRRQETGVTGRLDPDYETLRRELALEIADTVTYLDLLARHYGIDMGAAVSLKFNAVSEREGFAERLLGDVGRTVLDPTWCRSDLHAPPQGPGPIEAKIGESHHGRYVSHLFPSGSGQPFPLWQCDPDCPGTHAPVAP